jgi:uncharacterized protein
MEIPSKARPKNRLWVFAVVAIVLLLVLSSQLPILTILPWLWGRLTVFSTVFLGIFIEAVPFLLLGTLGSGLVEVFLNQDQFQRLIPRRAFTGALVGSLMGLVFPVCECGVVPLTRRLFSKGLPISAGIAFLLAAPVLNPIVILSTSAAFGWGWMLVGRLGLSMLMAVIVGLIFSVAKSPAEILLPRQVEHNHFVMASALNPPTLRQRLNQMAVIAGDEFFEMGRYLILGAVLAAAMQALIPQPILLELGRGPVTSVLVMLALAVILSICSTVDAFVVLGFVGMFSPGAILAFLIFGPMVDIKTTLMYLSVFKKRAVVYLILLPFALSFLAGLLVNLLG